ncbi:MAG TPA: hypothetical protein PKD64_15285 [Pirellulaceae bacterium]|nr:hypothetical protein [Pirellulaceae bacterium]HMO93548.1 hypothetical protein [Pirellulaceae bacterium]HMP70340.1 hypothetical protein [Pirellulaceae bacterium]
MFQILEYLFFAGVLLIALAVVLFLVTLVRKRFKRLWIPSFILCVGIVTLISPAIYTRILLSVDLGPRERMVDGEVHISLNGWDGNSYAFLQTRPETVVLQMANADVDDQALQYLRHMKNLRELDLNDSKVTDQGLKVLVELESLEVLRLRSTLITDQGFRDFLMTLPNLKNLDIRETSVSNEVANEWKNAKSGRRILR